MNGGCEITREMLDLKLHSNPYLIASRLLEHSDSLLINFMLGFADS